MQMASLDTKYQRSPEVVSREILGEMILVPIRQDVGDMESIFTLNETAAYIWSQLDGERTLGEIRDLVASEYQVSEEQAQADLLDLVSQLEDLKAISELR
jgi:hypothetical protein